MPCDHSWGESTVLEGAEELIDERVCLSCGKLEIIRRYDLDEILDRKAEEVWLKHRSLPRSPYTSTLTLFGGDKEVYTEPETASIYE